MIHEVKNLLLESWRFRSVISLLLFIYFFILGLLDCKIVHSDQYLIATSISKSVPWAGQIDPSLIEKIFR